VSNASINTARGVNGASPRPQEPIGAMHVPCAVQLRPGAQSSCESQAWVQENGVSPQA
jgi:hypothetical protein